MAWTQLKENYTDAVWSGLKRYSLIENDDGTISLQDVTVYSNKENSFYGALDANSTNSAINIIMAMVENGTDLYTNFQQYFATQENLFKQTADATQADFNTYLGNIKSEADDTQTDLVAYVNGLKEQGDSLIETIETDYSSEINQFENTQEQIFNAWFSAVQGRMSGDVATNILNQLDALTEICFNRYYGLCSKTTSIRKADDNTIITENDGSEEVEAVTTISTVDDGKRIVTVVTPENDSYTYTKTTLISKSDEGTNIVESYVKEAK